LPVINVKHPDFNHTQYNIQKETWLFAIVESLLFAGTNANCFNEEGFAPVHIVANAPHTEFKILRWMQELNEALEQKKLEKFNFELKSKSNGTKPL
jgi:hypothetical protein